MGLFTKEPAEKKAYWKAFNTMTSKPNMKTFEAMEEASKAWPTGWQGYLFMALSYDLASNKIPYDPDKADIYHKLAKEAGKRDNSEWLECFYEVFEREAGNFRMKEDYYPRAHYVRKAGVAMMYNFEEGKNDIVTNVRLMNDRNFWYILFSGIDVSPSGLFAKASDEQLQCECHREPFLAYLAAYGSLELDRSARLKELNRMIKGWGEFNKVKPDQVTPMSKDMFGFVFGYALIMGGGPYAQELSGAEGWHKNLRIDGWIRLWLSGNRGCMPSLHMIADFFDGQFSQEIYYAFSRAYTSHDTERKQIYPQLMTLLEMSAAKGDQEALRLINGLAK